MRRCCAWPQFYRIDFFAGQYDVQDMSEPEGFIAETMRPRVEEGIVVTQGKVLKGENSDYMVAGASHSPVALAQLRVGGKGGLCYEL